MKKGNLNAFFREKCLTKNTRFRYPHTLLILPRI